MTSSENEQVAGIIGSVDYWQSKGSRSAIADWNLSTTIRVVRTSFKTLNLGWTKFGAE
jgi:hypothetical protein